MKKITFILFALIAGTGFAQTDAPKATANASADIVSPLTIDLESDLNFGKVIPSSTIETNIILGQDGIIDGSSTGNSVNTSTQSAAEFTINATDGYLFSINVPSSITLTGGGPNMLVSLNPNLLSTSNLSEGNPITLLIGGTLNVGISQSEGNYSTTFDVSVAYE